MSANLTPIKAIPTNIITGFLGVGKTSAILHLMKHKAKHERWAILVNEFGEIGIDASLLQDQVGKSRQIFIREVPGGCMCCTAGLPMQVALNQLLTEAKPDRLLIEPTGLGHPKEVLQLLSSEHYQEVINLQTNITLVDARNLTDTRYTEHDTFNQQISIADTIIANKADLYAKKDIQNLEHYVAKLTPSNPKIILSEFGRFPITELNGRTLSHVQPSNHHHHGDRKPLASELPFPPNGIIKAINKGEGYQSFGWRFAPNKCFDRQAIHTLFQNTQAERLKASVITEQGCFGYNLTSDGVHETLLMNCDETRIEVISEVISESLESQLLNCLID